MNIRWEFIVDAFGLHSHLKGVCHQGLAGILIIIIKGGGRLPKHWEAFVMSNCIKKVWLANINTTGEFLVNLISRKNKVQFKLKTTYHSIVFLIYLL